MTGYDNGAFGSDDPVTREQAAAILYRYAKDKGYSTSATADLSGYTDAGKIDRWAEAAMKWANAEDLITGKTATTLDSLAGARWPRSPRYSWASARTL